MDRNIGSNKQNGHFLGSGSDTFDLISIACGDPLPEQNCIGDICIRALGVRTRNINFVETGSTGRMDFIVVLYSVTSSGLPSNSRFCFQGKIVEGSGI
jgi:hypothetical protein